MASKLAPPTPTMMMERGRLEAAMMAFFVASMSEIAPSVSINSTKYCCDVSHDRKEGSGQSHDRRGSDPIKERGQTNDKERVWQVT